MVTGRYHNMVKIQKEIQNTVTSTSTGRDWNKIKIPGGCQDMVTITAKDQNASW
jgi:hypothetical protein